MARQDIFVSYHVADDQHAFTGELADEACQPITLRSNRHADTFSH